MQPTKIILGTLGYAAVTFPLAYVWHRVLFNTTYEELGYFTRDEPVIAFGFASIIIQGMVLLLIYPSLCRGKSIVRGALTLAGVLGVYHWTMHVLAEAAKHLIEPLTRWFALETIYLSIQFVLREFIIALVHRSRNASTQPQ